MEHYQEYNPFKNFCVVWQRLLFVNLTMSVKTDTFMVVSDILTMSITFAYSIAPSQIVVAITP